MKKTLSFVICLMTANLVFAQGTDTTKTTKTTKTITTTTVITTEGDGGGKPSKRVKQAKEEKEDVVSEKKNIIKTSLTSFALRTFHLNYERVVTQKITVQLGAFYSFFGGNSINGSTNDSNTFGGFGITPEIRFYPKGVAPMGFFVGVSPRYQRYTFKESNNNGGTGSETTATAFGSAIIVGGQWIFGDVISLDLYGGPSLNTVNIKNSSGSQNNLSISGLSPVGFRFGVSVGVAF